MTRPYHRLTRLKPFNAAILSSALLLLTSTSALAQVSIDTIPGWNGTSYISSFGVANTATYGETVTVAAGASPLASYSFEIGYCSASVSFRGSVYAWDGTKATGPSLFTSGVQTVPASSAFQLVTFNVGSLNLPAGNYVLFASTSQDQAGAPNSSCRWGSVGNNTAYSGGQFVYINNGPDPTQWTTNAWSNIAQDLAFRVDGLSVAPNPTSVPTLSEWALLALAGLMGVFGLGAIRRRGGSY